MEVYQVHFTFEDGQAPKTVQAVEGESLLEIAHDNDVHLNHNCGGVCACSTCHVYVLEGMEGLPEISDSEENFIDRAINPRLESRLACQCKISCDVKVEIPDQSLIIGHEH